jgi:hypothetical protein
LWDVNVEKLLAGFEILLLSTNPISEVLKSYIFAVSLLPTVCFLSFVQAAVAISRRKFHWALLGPALSAWAHRERQLKSGKGWRRAIKGDK